MEKMRVVAFGILKKNSHVSHGTLFVFSRRLSSSLSLKESMQAWQTDEFCGINGLNLNSTKLPSILKPSEVLVRVSAASVNPLDTAMIEGYGRNVLNTLKKIDDISAGKCNTDAPQFPLTTGRDFVGDVVRVGQSVTNIKVNDRVWGVVLPQRQGSHAEYVVTEACNVCIKPSNLTDVEAATIPYIGLTSWSAAVFTGSLVPGDCFNKRVLILGASGGVGTFISQLLSTWGAHVISICSENAFELALSCGASEVYDCKDPETFTNLTSIPTFDLIIDAAGTNDIKWAKGLKEWSNASYVTLYSPLLRNTDEKGLVGGVVATISKLVKDNRIFSKGKLCKWGYFMPNHGALREITRLVESGRIRPIVDKTFPLQDAKIAYEHVREGHSRGKTVIDFNNHHM